MTGKKLRLGRIFKDDGRALIFAMDHGLVRGAAKGLERPRELIASVIKGGADAMLTSPGIVAHCGDIIKGKLAIILRIDGGTTIYRKNPSIGPLPIRSVEEALRMGADAVGVMGTIGTDFERDTLLTIAQAAEECSKWGMLLMAEMVSRKDDFKDHVTEQVKAISRIGAELGADFIKTPYTGSADSFREVVSTCLVPVVILGGAMEAEKTDESILRAAYGAIQAGGAGVAFGRNIWQHPRPEAITRAVASIVHGGATVEDALKLVK